MRTGIPSLDENVFLTRSEETAVMYLSMIRAIDLNKPCPKCGSIGFPNYPNKRCTNKGCYTIYSVKKGTFFEKSHLKVNEILKIGYFWLLQESTQNMIRMLGHSEHTITELIRRFDKLVKNIIVNEHQKIGGNGVIVEIDESKFGKRKYNEGHHVEGVWVVGAVERTPQRRIFATTVTSRDKDIIKSIIYEFIEPGSIIYSDCWKAYPIAIKELNESDHMNLEHKTVNHSVEFKSDEGVHTNTIEGNWNGMKSGMTSRHMNMETGKNKIMVFIWRRQNAGNLWNALMQALAEVRFQ